MLNFVKLEMSSLVYVLSVRQRDSVSNVEKCLSLVTLNMIIWLQRQPARKQVTATNVQEQELEKRDSLKSFPPFITPRSDHRQQFDRKALILNPFCTDEMLD